MTHFFTSDLHLGHVRICELAGRPFPDVDTMNEWIINQWNSQVGPDDDVDIVGDLCMGKIAESLPLAKRLNGSKVLLCGNHDRPWYGNGEKSMGWTARYRDDGGLRAVSSGEILCYAFFSDLGSNRPDTINICHFPYEGDHTEEVRYLDYRPKDEGLWLIHGHVHDAWRQRGRQINVGLDAWGGRLVTDEEIIALVEDGPQDLPVIPWMS